MNVKRYLFILGLLTSILFLVFSVSANDYSEFGYNDLGNNEVNIENTKGAVWDTAVGGNGTANHIMVRLDIDAGQSYRGNLTAALYEYIDYSSSYAGSLIASTVEVEIDETGAKEWWVQFNFSGTVNITNNTKYYVMVTAENTAGTVQLRSRSSQSGWSIYGPSGYSIPDPWTSESTSSYRRCLYVNYTVASSPESGIDWVYVGTNGSDANSGNSSSPYRTVDHGYDQLGPGKGLRIYEGEYDDLVFSYSSDRSGNITHPVIIESFPGHVVNLTVNNYTKNRGFFSFFNQSHMIIRNFNIKNVMTHGIWIGWNNPDQCHNLTFRNINFTNISGGAIVCAGGSAKQTYCYVDNCRIIDACNSYSHIDKNETISLNGVGYWWINNSFFANNVKWSIDVKSGSHNVYINNNTFQTTHDGGYLGNANTSAYGFAVRNAGGGVYIDGYSSTVNWFEIRENYFYGNKTAIQIGLEQGSVNDFVANGSVINNLVNLTRDDIACRCIHLNQNNVDSRAKLENIDILHNTLVGGFTGFSSDFYGLQVSNIRFVNNILDNQETGTQRDYANFSVNMTYNLLNNSGNVSDFYGNNLVNGSPHFVGATNFNLSAGSWAVDNGINVNVGISIEAMDRPNHVLYDIGCYEFVWVDTSPIPVISGETPTNGSTIYTLITSLEVTINDPNGDPLWVWFGTNCTVTGLWIWHQYNYSAVNFTAVDVNFTQLDNTTWNNTVWWRLAVNDGYGWNTYLYWFYIQYYVSPSVNISISLLYPTNRSNLSYSPQLIIYRLISHNGSNISYKFTNSSLLFREEVNIANKTVSFFWWNCTNFGDYNFSIEATDSFLNVTEHYTFKFIDSEVEYLGASLGLEPYLMIFLLLFFIFYLIHKIPEKYTGIHWIPAVLSFLVVMWNITIAQAFSVTNYDVILLIISISILFYAAYKDLSGWFIRG